LTKSSHFDILYGVTVCTALELNRQEVMRMTFEDVILLLSLLGGCIYATISITIKVLDFLQKKKD